MKILFVTKFVPFPLDNGGKIGTSNLLRALSKLGQVEYISFYENEKEKAAVKQLEEVCTNIKVVFQRVSIKGNMLKNIGYMVKSLFSRQPYYVVKFFSQEMKDYIDGLALADYDVIVIDGLNMFQYFENKGLKNLLLQEHNIEYLIMQRYYQYEKNFLFKWIYYLDYLKLKRYEIEAAKQANHVMFMTKLDESEIISQASSIKSYVVPVAVDVDEFTPLPQEKINFRNVLFSNGSLFYIANFDGLLWFDKQVLTKVLEKFPDLEVNHVGKYDEEHRAKLSPNIKLLGYVDDIKEYMNSNIIHIIPLRIGGGIRVKIINSLASGIPMVATEMAAEGIEVENHKNITLAKNEDEFAAGIVELLQDREQRMKYVLEAQKLSREVYSLNIFNQKIEKIVSEVTLKNTK